MLVSLLKKIFAVIMIIFGLLIIGGAIIQISEGKQENGFVTEITLIMLFGVLPIVAGGAILWYDMQSAKEKRITQAQIDLLRKAQASGGRITIAEAALALQEPINEAKITLDEMQSKGVFDIAITDDGTLEYVIAQELARVKLRKGSDYV